MNGRMTVFSGRELEIIAAMDVLNFERGRLERMLEDVEAGRPFFAVCDRLESVQDQWEALNLEFSRIRFGDV